MLNFSRQCSIIYALRYSDLYMAYGFVYNQQSKKENIVSI